MADNHPDQKSTTTSRSGRGGEASGRGSDLVERLLSKRLRRFDEERKNQETRMRETVEEFALRLLDEESRQTEASNESSAPNGQTSGAETPARRSEPETIIVALDADLVRRLRAAAEESQTSVSSVVESGVADWIEGYERMKRKRQHFNRLG